MSRPYDSRIHGVPDLDCAHLPNSRPSSYSKATAIISEQKTNIKFWYCTKNPQLQAVPFLTGFSVIAIRGSWVRSLPIRRISADIIADGLHLAPGIVKLFFAAKALLFVRRGRELGMLTDN